ncbi:MAG: hypothetical protein AABX66_02180 [Nanoarchaeota archaeon]
MNETIETEKWSIGVLEPKDIRFKGEHLEAVIRLSPKLKRSAPINDEDIKELEADFKDLGKWRKFKELKRDLENDKRSN